MLLQAICQCYYCVLDCPPKAAQFGSTCYWLETTPQLSADMLQGCQRVHPYATQVEVYTEEVNNFLATLIR